MNAVKVIGSALASTLCVVAILVAGAYVVLGHMGYRVETVLSGSMEPTLKVGSIAVIKEVPATELKRGDVATFANPHEKGTLTTHRIVAVEQGQSGPVFRTRGDANRVDDPWLLAQRGQMGQLALDVPYVGYATTWLTKPDVRQGVVIVGAVLALLIILRRIWSDEPAESPKTAEVAS